MKCHPVDFLLPTIPAPERHGVGESAIVEVVAKREVCLVTLLLRNSGENGWEFSLHLVPRKMDTSIVLQVPVHTRGDVHPSISSYHHLLALLVEFEEVFLTLHLLNLKLSRSALVDTLQEFIHRISPCLQGHQDCDNS